MHEKCAFIFTIHFHHEKIEWSQVVDTLGGRCTPYRNLASIFTIHFQYEKIECSQVIDKLGGRCVP